jgi:hypothetical protein
VAPVAAVDKQAEKHADAENRAPLLIPRIETKEHEAEVLIDDGPAGAIYGLALVAGGIPQTIEEGPFDERGNDKIKAKKNDQCQGGIQRAVEKIGPHPPDHPNAGYGGFDLFRLYLLDKCFHGLSFNESHFFIVPIHER